MAPRQQFVRAMATSRRHVKVFLAIAVLCGATASAEAQQVYRCVVDGRTVYQQEPCEGSKGKEVDTAPAVSASGPLPTPKPAPVTSTTTSSDPAPAPAAQGRPELETLADACLDWYRPLLRDPRGAYYRDASISKGVLSFTIYATNRRGGYEQLPGACEFRSGRLDEPWTKIQSRRLGW